MRIVAATHYRQAAKFKVWPMYDFANALEDSWCGVTHIMRSNEFESRIELQDYIKGLLGLQRQEVLQYGRFNIVGATTQGREIRKMIEEGQVIGWDDPRLITLRALRRRGIVKETYYELARICGMSKTQTNLDFGVLAAINRRILDEVAERYYFVRDPIKIIVDGWPTDLAHVELKLHPHRQRGGRPLKLSNQL
jgi:glutamyl-tRNA synthetase